MQKKPRIKECKHGKRSNCYFCSENMPTLPKEKIVKAWAIVTLRNVLCGFSPYNVYSSKKLAEYDCAHFNHSRGGKGLKVIEVELHYKLT